MTANTPDSCPTNLSSRTTFKARSTLSLSAVALAMLGVSSAMLGCSSGSEPGAEDNVGHVEQLVTYAPQPVSHPNTTKRIFMHYMPWFEANGVQHGYTRHGSYGSHWTMANCTAQTNGLLNRVCADDTPMIGPYSSSDPYVVEYHLLLMKYAGIDGAVIDWGGVMNVSDLPDNKYNGEALMSQLSNFGLKFMVMNEDRNYVRNNGPNDFNNPINNTDDTNDMANDLNCLKANGTCGNLYFGSGNYEKLAGNNTPILGDFGPVNYRVSNGNQWVWDNAWSQAGLSANSTTLFSLWWQEGDESNENRGSSAWVWSGAGAVGNSSWTILDHETYYANNATAPGTNRVKMGSVVPAYYPFYQQGGWSADAATFTISYNNGSYIDNLFNIVLPSNENYVQMVTWNDFGEGTEFEPTVNKGFTALQHVQQKLGVAYGVNELTLIYNLFNARIAARKANDSTRLGQLDQASAYLAALNTSAAASIINGTSAEAPYGNGGNAWTLPGTLEAENFDVGGEGVAYHDAESTNQGGQYRTSDGVDVETCGEGGYDVGWTNGGEWLKYTVNVTTTGTYQFAFRAANGGTGTGSFAVNVDGNALTGNLNVAPTGGWQTYTTVNSGNVSLTAGQHVLTLSISSGGFNLNKMTVTSASTNNAYGGTPWAIPGTIEGENYDIGGEGQGYHDSDAANNGGQYRTSDGVDVEVCQEGGYDVGWGAPGEWMKYTVNVATAGSYKFTLRTANQSGGAATGRIDLDGSSLTGNVTIPTTATWQTWQDVVTSAVTLPAGQHTLTWNIVSGGLNLNRISVAAASTSEAPYGGTAWAVPGTVQAENYDTGGEGVAFHDSDSVNSGGQLRSDGVDVETCGDTGGGYDVGYMNAGEWMNYTINVGTAGNYTFTLRGANASGGTAAGTVSIDGTNVTGTISVTGTGGWQTYQNFTSGSIALTAGQHIMRFDVVTGGMNLNNIVVSSSSVLNHTLQNVANGMYMYLNGTTVGYTSTPSAYGTAAQWTFEDYAGYKRIHNVSNNCEVDIENLLAYAQCRTGDADAWMSNRWTFTMVGTNYVFNNAWQNTQLNLFNNPPAGVQCTARATNTDAQWIYAP